MELPGKLTEWHIENAIANGRKVFIYRNRLIDVEKCWSIIQAEKAKTKRKEKKQIGDRVRSRHQTISSESEKAEDV